MGLWVLTLCLAVQRIQMGAVSSWEGGEGASDHRKGPLWRNRGERGLGGLWSSKGVRPSVEGSERWDCW